MTDGLPKVGDRLLVSLATPIHVILNEQVQPFHVFEGELLETSTQFLVFRTFRLRGQERQRVQRPSGDRSIATVATWFSIRTNVTVNTGHIAGVVPAPKEVRR